MEQLNKFRDMIAFGLMFIMGFIYLQTNFVIVRHGFSRIEQQLEEKEEEANYLRDKELRLQKQLPPQELQFEDKRQLERLEKKIQQLEQRM